MSSERILSIPDKLELCNYNSKIAIRTRSPGLGTQWYSLGRLSSGETRHGQLALLKDNGEIVGATRVECQWRPYHIESRWEFPRGVVVSQRVWIEAPFAHAAVSIEGKLSGARLVAHGSSMRGAKALVSPEGAVMIEEMDPSLKPFVLQIASSAKPDKILLSPDGKEWREQSFVWAEGPVEYRMVYDRLPREMTVSAHLGGLSSFVSPKEWEDSRRREGEVKGAWLKLYDEDFPDVDCPDPRIRDLVQLCAYANWSGSLQPGGMLPYPFGVPSKYYYPMWWMWDSAFHSIPAAWFRDPSLAFGCLLSHTIIQSGKGCVMDAACDHSGDTGDGQWLSPEFYDETSNPCTGPCVTGVAVRDVYRKTGSVEFLKKMYPHLVLYERWLTEAKASKIDSDLIAYTNWFDVGWDDSKRWGRSGMMDHPDIDVGWALPVVPVDANVFFLVLRKVLADTAKMIGDAGRHREYLRKSEATRLAIEKRMWNEKEGFYFDILPDGKMLDVWTPAGFLPLMEGLPDQEAYQRMKSRLFDPGKFWSKYPLPTIALDDEHFSMNNLWRGGTWVNVNWQVMEGLFRYDPEAGSQLLWRTIDMMTKDGHPVCPEYFDPNTAEPQRAADYGWTTLAADMILRRLFGVEPMGDRVVLRPHLPPDWSEARLRNLFLSGTSLEIRYERSAGELKALVKNKGRLDIVVVSGSNSVSLRAGTETVIRTG